jgi:YidC/Oxa1 family membrane protein insertase
LYKPLYNLLIFFYNFSPGKDMGLAVIMFTIFIRLLLIPLSIRGARSEIRLEQLKPLIEEIKERYQHNIEKQREAIRRLLQKNNISVFSNVIALAFQIFFFVILYEIYASGLQPGLGHNDLYGWMRNPGIVDPHFLNQLNLIETSQSAALFAGGTMLVSQLIRYMMNKEEATTIERVMLVALPLGIYFGCIVLPSAKALFISTSIIFSLILLGAKTVTLRFLVKDEKLKQTIDDLWTS